jgi:uncharacterized membrane protein
MSGFVTLLIVLVLAVVLPLLALARASRAIAEIEALRRELEKLRRELRERGETPAAGAAPADTRPAAAPAAAATATLPEAEPPAAAAAAAAEPAPPAAPPAPVPAAAPAAAAASRESLEARIGSRWLLYIGVAAIVVATSYFVKLAFDSRWITETMRVSIGAAGGLLLAWVGARFVRAGYAVYGQMLIGGGVAILYLAVYASFNLYDLVGQPVAFGLMLAVTVFAAWLADRHRSQGLAVMAVGGGFLTPFLVGSRTDAQAPLFAYDAFLVAGTAALARRRAWPILNLVSYWLTFVTVAGWLLAFYTPSAYLRTVLFLTLFCALFGVILASQRDAPGPLARGTRGVLGTAPPIYYVVSVALLYPHSLAFLLFLIAATLTGLIVSRRLASRWGPVALWAAVWLPLVAWVNARADGSWLLPGTTVILALYALHLVGHLDRLRHDAALREDGLGAADIALLHLNGLGAYALLHDLVSGWHYEWLVLVAFAMAAWHVYLATLVKRWRDEAPAHLAVVSATLASVALAIWTGGPPLVIGWAVEAAGLTALGLRREHEWLRLTGAALLGLAAVRLLALLFGPIDAHYTVVLNARVATTLIVAALFSGLGFLHRWRGGPLGPRTARDAEFFALAAHLLVLVMLTTEINAFFELRGGGRPAALAHAAALAVAWTLQGAALVRLGLSRRSRRLRAAGAVALTVAALWPFAGRLGLVPGLWLTALAGLTPAAGYVVFVNARAAAALVLIVALYAVAAMRARARREPGQGGAFEVAAAVVGASVVTLGLLSGEVSAFWALREQALSTSYEFARQLSLSVAWAGYAAALIAVGIRRRYAPLRYFGIGTFLATIIKVLVVDLSELERLYRVLSVAALGLLLLVASFLYQRYRDRLAPEPAPPEGAGPPDDTA